MTSHNIKDKFVLYLNSSLAMENAALERVQRRSEATILEEVKQQLERHFRETQEHRNRLIQLITQMGGTPTQEKGKLPIAMPPESITQIMHPSMTPAEQELIQSVEDSIVESAEVIGYNLLIQMAGKLNIADAMPVLGQSLQEEEKMFGWLKANSPALFARLWLQVDPSSSTSVPRKTTSPTSSYKIKNTRTDISNVDQSFKCESCNVTFHSREDLKQHTIQKHEGK
jgi:ferritin-like metal-binding protein YciE